MSMFRACNSSCLVERVWRVGVARLVCASRQCRQSGVASTEMQLIQRWFPDNLPRWLQLINSALQRRSIEKRRKNESCNSRRRQTTSPTFCSYEPEFVFVIWYAAKALPSNRFVPPTPYYPTFQLLSLSLTESHES